MKSLERFTRAPSPLKMDLSTRGVTLVELMIVVAVVGILASLASVSFVKYVTAGKVTELSQFAMDVSRGQEQYHARNNQYYEPAAAYTSTSQNDPQWTNLLEFDPLVGPEIIIEVEAGLGDGNCSICDAGTSPDTSRAWFAVRATNTDIKRAVVLTNEMGRPLEVAAD